MTNINAVIKLQQDALNPSIDTTSLLRTAYLIASKLSLTDFKQWISHELNGYDTPESIPQYRNVHGELQGHTARGWIPVSG